MLELKDAHNNHQDNLAYNMASEKFKLFQMQLQGSINKYKSTFAYGLHEKKSQRTGVNHPRVEDVLALQRILDDAKYTLSLKDAFLEYIDNPDHFSWRKLCPLRRYVRNAVNQYIKQHNIESLELTDAILSSLENQGASDNLHVSEEDSDTQGSKEEKASENTRRIEHLQHKLRENQESLEAAQLEVKRLTLAKQSVQNAVNLNDQEELLSAKKELQNAKESLNKAETEIERLKNECQELLKVKNQNEAKIVHSESNSEEYRLLNAELSCLQKEAQSVSAELIQAKKENQSISEELLLAQNEKRQIKELLDQVQEEKQSIIGDINQVKKETQHLSDKLNLSEAERQRFGNDLSQAQTNLVSTKKLLDTAEKSRDQAIRAQDMLQRKNEQFVRIIHQQNFIITSLHSKISDLKTKIESFKNHASVMINSLSTMFLKVVKYFKKAIDDKSTPKKVGPSDQVTAESNSVDASHSGEEFRELARKQVLSPQNEGWGEIHALVRDYKVPRSDQSFVKNLLPNHEMCENILEQAVSEVMQLCEQAKQSIFNPELIDHDVQINSNTMISQTKSNLISEKVSVVSESSSVVNQDASEDNTPPPVPPRSPELSHTSPMNSARSPKIVRRINQEAPQNSVPSSPPPAPPFADDKNADAPFAGGAFFSEQNKSPVVPQKNQEVSESVLDPIESNSEQTDSIADQLNSNAILIKDALLNKFDHANKLWRNAEKTELGRKEKESNKNSSDTDGVSETEWKLA